MSQKYPCLAISLVGTCVAFCSGSHTWAQEAESSPWEIDGAVTVVSDYRFRGLSLSDEAPALQPELWISHQSGLYAGVWGSTIADGNNLETDLTLGFASAVGPFEAEIYATWYLYPGSSGFDYVEVTSTLSAPVGPITATLELAYAPAQPNIGDVDNRYVAVRASLPVGKLPVQLIGAIGLEDGAFGDAKIDWSLGLSGEIGGLEVSAVYVDSARNWADPLADPGAVISLKKNF